MLNIELAGLLAASLVICIGTLLTYFGQVGPIADDAARVAKGEIVDLNRVQKAGDLVAALKPALPESADRAFAARELFQFISTRRAQGETLVNVGALGRATVDPARVRSTQGLQLLRERAAGRDRPFSVLTASQIADIKSLVVVRDFGQFRNRLLFATVLLLAGFYLVHGVRRWRGLEGDGVLLPAVHLLTGIGFLAMIALRDPLRDTTAFLGFAQGVAGGCLLMAAIAPIDFQRSELRNYVGIPLALALLLSLLLVIFGSGPGSSDAKVNLFGVQPVEAIRLLVVFSLAAYFARRWELLRELSESRDRLPAWMSSDWFRVRVPRLVDVRPLAISVTLIVGFFFWQRDLGPALVIGVLFLTMYAVARARVVLVLLALSLLVLAFWGGYQLRTPRTVAQRVDIWLSPWDNAQPGGDQVAQALWAMSAGSLWGSGPGLGDPQIIPAGHTDLVLATVGEELGWIGVLVVLLTLGVIIYRALRIATRAPGDFTFFLVLGLTVTLAAQALLIAAGLLGLLPLSGVVTPFLSFGRSSMLANCLAIGIVLAVSERARGPVRAPFVRPVRWVGIVFLTAASLVLLRAAWVQVVRADETLVAASLTLQGDGARRYTYNPRLIAAARTIGRGTIFDRHGVPLASSRPEELLRQKAALDALGVRLDTACPERESRCYPLGGVAFHVLGDWSTQRNWAARNTSFVERDSDRDLRGYDDHAKVVEVANARTGVPTPTIVRDYRALIPLVRYRYEPSHPAVLAIHRGVRDVTTTLDARLQVRVARALERHIREHRYTHGAVVVLNPADGSLLASVSYPWPNDGPRPAGSRDAADQEWLDRARYGLYPPGSTYKIVTAAAALRQNPDLARTEFMCRPLSDGRVGIQIPKWTRPIRDDELDHTAHGAVAMTRGIVVSCNAYFAQLGLRVGPQALLDASTLFQIAPAEPATAAELGKGLPFASYGQGEVRATPLRMATVAGTIATGGQLRQPSWILDANKSAASVRVLDRTQAAALAGAMRQVVTGGTGRALAGAVLPVAGKTGTAQVDGAASHSWFIGYAPFAADRIATADGEGRTIAFAVLLENAGYGAKAAPVVADVVRAARELGIVH